MTWETKNISIARRSTQTRFVIHTEQLEFASPEFVQALNNDDENEALAYKDGFAKELLSAIGDELSVSDLKQILDVFGKKYAEREAERQERIKYNANQEKEQICIKSDAITTSSVDDYVENPNWSVYVTVKPHTLENAEPQNNWSNENISPKKPDPVLLQQAMQHPDYIPEHDENTIPSIKVMNDWWNCKQKENENFSDFLNRANDLQFMAVASVYHVMSYCLINKYALFHTSTRDEVDLDIYVKRELKSTRIGTEEERKEKHQIILDIFNALVTEKRLKIFCEANDMYMIKYV